MKFIKIAIMLLCVYISINMTACSEVDIIFGSSTSEPLKMRVGQSVQVPLFLAVCSGLQEEDVQEICNNEWEIQWTVFDERVVEVDESGIITALAAGSTRVTAYVVDKDVSVSTAVTVFEQPERIEVADVILNTVSKGYPVSVKVYPENAVVESIEYTITDPNIAVIQAGKLTAVGAGTTDLTVTVDGIESSAAITVLQAPNSINGEDIVLRVGESTYVNVNPDTDTAETGLMYTYSSEDKAVAFVEVDGKVTAVGKGETVIRVWNELDQTCLVNVLVE